MPFSLRVDKRSIWSVDSVTWRTTGDTLQVISNASEGAVADLLVGKIVRTKADDIIDKFSLEGSKNAIVQAYSVCTEHRTVDSDFFQNADVERDPDSEYFL